jgi:glycosyltransferase involved in cell wall biosynthesis
VRILQALPWYFPESLGGTEVYVDALSRWLKGEGHEVSVAAPAAGLSGKRDYTHEGIQVFRYPIPVEASFAEVQELTRTRGAEEFDAHLLRLKPDVVHFHTLGTGLGLNEVKSARTLGAKIIYTSHSSALGFTCQRGSLMECGDRICDGRVDSSRCAVCVLQQRGVPKRWARLMALTPRSVGRMMLGKGRVGTVFAMPSIIDRNQRRQQELLANVEAFVVLTEWAHRVVLANGAPQEKVHVNRLGVSTSNTARGLKPVNSPIRVGYLGRFEDIKGVYDLASAFQMLPREMEIRLEFRGPTTSETDRAMVRRIKALLREDARVSFAPAVKPSEVSEILRGYDVLCCPSLCLEGGPTVALEAFAVGTPVIGSRIGGLAEIVEEDVSGLLFEPGDLKAMTAVLERLAIRGAQDIARWQKNLPRVRTMPEIGGDYLNLYRGT